VQQTPATDGHPVESALVEQLAAASPDCEPLLIELLEHESPVVVAYAMLTLELRDSHALRQLPPHLLERRAALTIAIGSAKIDTTLADLALQIQQRAQPKRQVEREGFFLPEASTTTTFTWSAATLPPGLEVISIRDLFPEPADVTLGHFTYSQSDSREISTTGIPPGSIVLGGGPTMTMTISWQG
jgi:hypothetical protein